MQERSPIVFDPLIAWLQTLGLESNPFDSRYLDAGADSQISAYLVGHQAFDAIWKDQTSLIFAPKGGGKSSFRVRLTHACRVGQDGRRIFPVVYKLPEPEHFDNEATVLEQHFRFITQKMATELLLLLLYRPEKWNKLRQGEQRQVALQLWFYLPIHPIILTEQLRDTGHFTPLLTLYDATASQLPAQPNSNLMGLLCNELLMLFEQLQTSSPRTGKPRGREQFDTLATTVKSIFDYEAIYLMIDGVDAYAETTEYPRRVIELLEPLWRETTFFDASIFLKYFLPTELKPLVTAARFLPYGAIFDSSWVDIHWTRERLIEVLSARVRVASEGKFDTLDAISTPALRGLHAELVDAVPNSPREVLVLAERLLWEHAQRSTDELKLEPEDLQQALAWYRQQEVRV